MVSEMTVKELKEVLVDVPNEALVVLSRGIVGNAFSPACTCSQEAIYIPRRHPWQTGEAYTKTDPEFERLRGRQAFVLWPVH